MKNMKNILKYALAAGIAAVMLASCDLDLVPTTSIAYTPGESPMLTATDVTEFTNGVLSSYRGLYYGVYSQTSEVMCDGFNAVVDYGNNYGSEHRMDDSFSADNYDTRDLWSGNYGSIKNFNIAIENADGVADDLKAAARTMKGYAFFGRASSYLTLARHFGKAYGPSASTDLCVPLVLKYNQVEKPERATVAAVYAAIKEDLDSAAVILANAKGAVRSQKPTIDAVNALYARYLLRGSSTPPPATPWLPRLTKWWKNGSTTTERSLSFRCSPACPREPVETPSSPRSAMTTRKASTTLHTTFLQPT